MFVHPRMSRGCARARRILVMAMVCAQCNQVYEQSERICPACGLQLFVHRRSSSSADESCPVEQNQSTWQQSAWGRILICLLLVQGSVFCLQQLFTAWFLVSGSESQGSWHTPVGLILLHSFHVIALL